MEQIHVKIKGKELLVNRGVTIDSLKVDYINDYKYEIIMAKVNGIYKELNSTIQKDCEVEFFDLMTCGSNQVYLNGLVFMMIVAFKQLYGGKEDLKVCHSLDKGLYIEPSIDIDEEKLEKLSNKMRELVSKNLPITKLTVSRLDAIEYFESIGYTVKADIMKYVPSTHLTLYKLDSYYDYFYSMMPTSTSVLSHFELTYLDNNGFVLRFPTIYMEDKIKSYEHRSNVFNLFRDSRDWAKRLNLENVVDLNRIVSNSQIEEIIRIDEMMKNSKLLEIASEIEKKKDKVKVVLLAGPSSTGKTTTTNKLVLCLKTLGLNPKMVSMDDFFVEREETPIDEDGNPDFERLETVDLKLFDAVIERLLNHEEVLMPTFNFLLGKKEYKEKMQLGENDILLIEGIHALNPKVLAGVSIDKKIRIYLSALTELNLDKHTRVSTTDNRLLRRIVRDNRTRGNKVEDTLEKWTKVREGEEKYIFPYQDEADYTFNTALIYELGVLKTFVEPLLYSVPTSSPYYNDAIRLINFLGLFLPISSESIPVDSIVREFIGGGCFKV